jgi:hypothetical protein
MTREHPPCSACARFTPGHCAGFDRPAKEDDAPCVLFVERGSRADRLLAKNDRELLAEQQRRHPETISRASAPQQSKLERETT